MTTDLGAPVLEQLVLLELMRTSPGLTDERRADLRAGRDALVAGLRTHLPGLAFTVPVGGLSLWCELPPGVDATAVAIAAEDEGLLVASGPRFSVAGGLDRWVRLPYVLDPATMATAAERLASAVATVAGGHGGRVPADRAARHRTSRPLVA